MTPDERDCVFVDKFRDDLEYRVRTDRKTALRILKLIEDVVREPYTGMGKPERLKHLDPGLWSRRITQEHRLVYLVESDRISFLQARFLYDL